MATKHSEVSIYSFNIMGCHLCRPEGKDFTVQKLLLGTHTRYIYMYMYSLFVIRLGVSSLVSLRTERILS